MATIAPKPQKAPTQREKAKTEPKPEPVNLRRLRQFDVCPDEISSLEAELAHEQQLYAKRPRIYRSNAASTMRDKGAW